MTLSIHLILILYFLILTFNFLPVFFISLFRRGTSFFISCLHSFSLIEMGVEIDGILCWVCEIVRLSLFPFYLIDSIVLFMALFGVYSLLLYLHVNLLLEKRGFSGYSNVFCESHTLCIKHFPSLASSKKVKSR